MAPSSTPFAAQAQSLADYAVRTAKSKFGRSLDFTRRSLPALDALLAQAYDRFCELDNDGKLSDETILHSARIWGSYLGEIVRRTWGGHWALKDGQPVLAIGGLTVDPIGAAIGPMTDPESELASLWFSKLDGLLEISEPASGGFHTLLRSLANLKGKIAAIQIPTIPTIPRAARIAILFTGLLIVLAALIGPARRAFNAWQFQSSFNRFQGEGDRLSSLSGQDMNVFRSQFNRVEEAYAGTGVWPYAFALRKIEFEEAIRGWDLALEIWDYSQSASRPVPFINQNGILDPPASLLLQKGSAYIGVGFNTGSQMTAEQWVAGLLLEANRRFQAAGQTR